MNIKRELIALGIRMASNKTSLIGKPDPFDHFMSALFGTETREDRLARTIDEETDRAAEAAKRAVTNFKFKKITKNY